MSRLDTAVHWLRLAAPFLMATGFTLVMFWLMVAKHDAFNTRTYDFARFDQAIWDTLHGRFLFTTIDYRSILGNHFSLYMALLSPLFLLWPDERALFMVQAVSLAAAGIILYQIVNRRRPELSLALLLAFYLNPALHELGLFEFRRVVLAVPYLALALYALAERRRGLMLVALLIALLCKEDIGLFVLGVGLYLLLFERDWKWGSALLVLGAAWTVMVTLWVIPAFRTDLAEYPQLFYFSYLGNSYSEIWATLRNDPLILLRQLLTLARLQGIWQLLLPLGVFLPFLAPQWLIIALPPLTLLLLAGDAEMYGLLKWYPSPILPVLFAAVGMGLCRVGARNGRIAAAFLVLMSGVGYLLYSPFPLGGQYQPAEYAITRHDRVLHALVTAVPPDASIATQPDIVPHLAHRQDVYHYPWVEIGAANLDYLLLDRESDPYPFTREQLNAQITEMLADPRHAISLDSAGAYLFRQNTENIGAPVGAVARGGLVLTGYDVAVQNADGLFRPVTPHGLMLEPGQQLRVSLYWHAQQTSRSDRSVSVRVAAPDGSLLAQHDGVPALGSRPTSWWQRGDRVRDIHYLTVSHDAAPGLLSLDVVLYDTYTHEIVWLNYAKSYPLTDVLILPSR